jgi:acyl carrier protein
MSSASAERVRGLILAECSGSLALFGHTPQSVPDDFDLRAQGVIDSLGFLELIATLQQELRVELDLELLDPDRLTVVGPLSRFVAEQVNSSPAATNGARPEPTE